MAQSDLSYIAHRGASYLAPENTLESMRLAWELGSDGAECDIMLTKDHQIILFHDKDGSRLIDQDLVISESNYDELKDYPIQLKETNERKYASAKIPLLKDVLEELPENQLLVIEIKTGKEIMPYLTEVISGFWQQGQIAFIAFDYDAIIAAKKAFPDVPAYYLSSSLDDVNERFDEIIASDLDGVDLYHGIIDRSLVERFNEENKAVWCWTVNTPDIATKMKSVGVFCITTDRPAWLKSQME